jgi:hypothetical protein
VIMSKMKAKLEHDFPKAVNNEESTCLAIKNEGYKSACSHGACYCQISSINHHYDDR